MRIGIYADAPRSNGGVFRYTMTLLEMLRVLDVDDEFVVLHWRRTDVPVNALTGGRWSSAMMPSSVMDVVRDVGVRVIGEDLARRVWYTAAWLRPNSVVLNPKRDPAFDKAGAQWYRDHGLDLVLYPVYS